MRHIIWLTMFLWLSPLHAEELERLCPQLLEGQSVSEDAAGVLQVLKARLEGLSRQGLDEIVVGPEDVRSFISREGSFNLVSRIHNLSRYKGFQAVVMIPVNNAAVSSGADINHETGEDFFTFTSIYEGILRVISMEDFRKLLKDAKKSNGSYKHRERLVKILRLYSEFISEGLNKPVDLLSVQGVLDFFEVSSKAELMESLKEFHSMSERVIEGQALSMFETLSSRFDMNGSRVLHALRVDSFGGERVPVDNNSRHYFTGHPTKAETEDLINAIGLKKSDRLRFSKYVERVNVDLADPEARHIANSLLIFRAYMDAGGTIKGFSDTDPALRVLQSKFVLLIQSEITAKNRIKTILDEQYEGYIASAEAINKRVVELRKRAGSLRLRSAGHRTQLRKIIDQISVAKVNDFGEDLEALSEKVFKMEVQVDSLARLARAQSRAEDFSVRDLRDIDADWSRLKADKVYLLEGLDYDSVSFSNNVIDHFKRNPAEGGRYLIALQKGYVAFRGNSGLRADMGIHEDFRDIKVLKRGKVRIVGRIVDRQIHFFHIFTDDSYPIRATNRLIENYSSSR